MNLLTPARWLRLGNRVSCGDSLPYQDAPKKIVQIWPVWFNNESGTVVIYFDNLISRTKLADFKLAFLRGIVFQVLLWPVLCLFMVILLWYWTNTTIDTEKHTLEAHALADASVICKDYTQYLSHVIEEANQITLQMKYAWETTHRHINLREMSDSGIFRGAHIVNAIIVNRNGYPTISSVPTQHNVSLADRDFFVFHKGDDSNVLLIGKTLVGRLSGKTIITFSRRLNAPNGDFDGIAVVSFSSSYLTSFYAGSFPGKTGLLAVVGLDGTLRSIKIGNEPDLTSSLRYVPLFGEPEGAVLLNEQAWFGDKLARFVAWKTMEDYPIVAMVGISEQEYFASHQETWAAYKRLALLGSIILFMFSLVAVWMSARIAWRKYQEEEMRKAYRVATDNGNEGYYLYEALRNKNGTIVDFVLVDCNARGAEFFGIPQTQLVQTKLSNLYQGDYFNEWMNIFRSGMQSGFYEDEVKAPQESNSKIEWLKRRLIRSGNGLTLTVQDITEHKRQESEIRENEQRLLDILNVSPIGVRIATRQGREVVFYNQAYADLIRNLDAIGDDPKRYYVRSEEYEEVIAILAQGKSVINRLIELRMPHGSTVWTLASYMPIRYKDEEAMLGWFYDVTDRKRAEEELIRYRQHLEELVETRTEQLNTARIVAESASRAKSEFLSSMSHELRTPLNAILGYAQLFNMNPDLSADIKEQARDIEDAGRHLLALINDMIDLSRIEAGKMELSMEPVSVRAVTTDSLAMIASMVSKHGIELVDVDGAERENMVVYADNIRLRQVLINLLSNAIKYNRPHGSVRLACQAMDGRVRISVADTGLGIPADKQSRIFNAFDRLGRETGAVEGTGIGLVITKRIVEAMGGSIGFESTEGQGSTFWVELNRAN